MSAVIEHALAKWGLGGASYDFVAGRENQIYRVEIGGDAYALRIKRKGYRDEAELKSELLWLNAMDRAGLCVPRPKRARDGALLGKIDGYFVDVVGWLDGAPLGSNGSDTAREVEAMQLLGTEMAKLHLACDAWSPPAGFVRCAWDLEGLLGEAALWGQFWQNPTLDADTRDLLAQFRTRALSELHAQAKTLDYGLIHADMLHENVLYDGRSVRLLDFDDGGFGFRLFDIATTLLRFAEASNFPEVKRAFLSGYTAMREIETAPLDLFLALRAMTYVGWIVPRISEPGGTERNHRLVTRAAMQARAYLQRSE